MAIDDVLIIAHRGASGYLPEHTLAAKAYAHALGADFIEQDLVATRDDQLVVLHDIHVDRVTDVAAHFPDRARDDGRFYVRDFDLAELKQLNVHERRKDDGVTAVYPARYPGGSGLFRIPTFAEELELIAGLNQSTGRNVGIYPEIKRPAWHRADGVDISRLVLDALSDAGYRTAADNVYLQCFDAAEVRRIRQDLGCELKLIQLLAANSWGESETDYDHLQTAAGLAEIAAVADGIGPWIGQLVRMADIDGQAVSTGLVSAAHSAGLKVHPYTFRVEELVPGFDTLGEMVHWFVDELQIDGVFTDFPDLARRGLSM